MAGRLPPPPPPPSPAGQPRAKQNVTFGGGHKSGGGGGGRDEEKGGLLVSPSDKISGGLNTPSQTQAAGQPSVFASLAFWRSSSTSSKVAPTTKRQLTRSLLPQVG